MPARNLETTHKMIEESLTKSWKQTQPIEKTIPVVKGPKVPKHIDIISGGIDNKLEKLGSINNAIRISRLDALSPEVIVMHFVENSHRIRSMKKADAVRELKEIEPIVTAASSAIHLEKETSELIDALNLRKDIENVRDVLNEKLKKHLAKMP